MRLKDFQKDILIKNMKKIKLNKRILNKVFNGIINTMIPESKDKIMPKGSDAINIKFFIKNILRNAKLKNTIYKKIYNSLKINKSLNYFELGSKIAKSKIIEKDIENYLLESYFTSKRVQKQLQKKTNKILPRRKTNNKDITLLLKVVKKSRVRYKDV